MTQFLKLSHEFLPFLSALMLLVLVKNSNFSVKQLKRKQNMNDNNPTHLLMIDYVAKLEHEVAELKAENARLKAEPIENVNTDEGC